MDFPMMEISPNPPREASILRSNHASLSPSGSSSRPCCPSARMATAWVPSAQGCRPSGLRQAGPGRRLRLRLLAHRRPHLPATTLRRRRDEWIAVGLMEQLERIAREGYDRLIGLQLEDVSIDGCITKAPCGGELAGPSPVDRASREPSARLPLMAQGFRSVCWPPLQIATTHVCWHPR